MRRLLTIALALVFVLGLSGLALAANFADVDQNAGTYNTAYINQTGAGGNSNFIDSDQTATRYYNYLDIFQSGQKNTVRLKQIADDYNIAVIDQTGNSNKLGQGTYCGGMDLWSPAFQRSWRSWNKLDYKGTLGNNKAGLYQLGDLKNYAWIRQWGGNNTLGVYQTNFGGYNSLTVTQTGWDTGWVCQTAAWGNNIAVVAQ